ncbi:S66 peptidase family protein [Microbacterium dextranolyticum]|uniref:Carboxypeptidase n=1 Tax=Microbacterium dextranolyticum TaxID=36806 RepID=A0A9W6HM51_9MICO|nr:LD-carboxypeptidase [Microbacterium dextranolyticum]MBM7464252.1 muramoyltetrapeptide carboxypeptidase [Microbacterium dextranolyticum]GLJ95246.1 putative carboxypeptidase [Microbacterium dextranolyticum]
MSALPGGIDRHAYLDVAPLQPGDRVAMITPSGPGRADRVAQAIRHYRDWGLDVTLGAHVLEPHPPRAPYLAGADAGRRSDLVEAWLDPEIAAVVSLGGGYGAMRLLDEIDWVQMAAAAIRPDGRPKLLTGSSDITALHEAFRFHIGGPTLFCPMAGNQVFLDSEIIRRDVHRWLFEPWRGGRIAGPRTAVLAPGTARGRITGGCLALLTGSLGSPESLGADHDGILILEDVAEEIYRLDGFLLALERSGRLDAATAVALGSWQECTPVEGLRPLMDEFFGARGIPVLWEVGFGHDPNAISVPLNVDGLLIADADDPRIEVTGPRGSEQAP